MEIDEDNWLLLFQLRNQIKVEASDPTPPLPPFFEESDDRYFLASEMNRKSFYSMTGNKRKLEGSNALLSADVKKFLIALPSKSFELKTPEGEFTVGPALLSYDCRPLEWMAELCELYYVLSPISEIPCYPPIIFNDPFIFGIFATIQAYLRIYERCVTNFGAKGHLLVTTCSELFSWARNNFVYFYNSSISMIDSYVRTVVDFRHLHTFLVELKLIFNLLEQTCILDLDNFVASMLFVKNCFQPYYFFLSEWLFKGVVSRTISSYKEKSAYGDYNIEEIGVWEKFFSDVLEKYKDVFQITTYLDIVPDVLICGKSIQFLQFRHPRHLLFSFKSSELQPLLTLGFSKKRIDHIIKHNLSYMIQRFHNVLEEYDGPYYIQKNWGQDILENLKNELRDRLLCLNNRALSYQDDRNVMNEEELEEWISDYPTSDKGTNVFLTEIAQYLDDNYSTKKDAIDFLSNHMFDYSLDMCILSLIKQQAYLVNRCMLMHFFTKEKLYEDLEMFSQFFLLRDGLFCQNLCIYFYEELFEILPGLFDEVFTSINLTEALQEALHHHSNPCLASLTIKIVEPEIAYSYMEMENFEHFQLSYEVDFPCDIIITDASRATYSRIFNILLQAAYATFCTDKIWFDWSRLGRKTPSILHSSQFRKIMLWRYEFQLYVRRIKAILSCYTHIFKWEAFILNIKQHVGNIKDLRNAHSSFVEQCARLYDIHCTESTRMLNYSSSLYIMIFNVLQYGHTFHKLLSKAEWNFNIERKQWECSLFAKLEYHFSHFKLVQRVFDSVMSKLDKKYQMDMSMENIFAFFTGGNIIA